MKVMIPYCSWRVRNTGTSCNAVRCFERFNPNHYSLGTPFNVSTLLTKVWRNVIECDFPKQTCTMCMIFPTLSQTKPRKNPRLQYAFNIQVLVVFCNSHWLSHLAAIFIDKRAEWSTVYSRIFSTIFISSRETEGYQYSTPSVSTHLTLAHSHDWQHNAIICNYTSAAIGRLLIESSNLIGPYHMRHVSDQLHRLADQTPKLTTLCKYAIRDWQPIIRQTRH